MSQLNIDRLIKTKIVCTLGPACSSREILEQMVNSGMDLVRLNFSHGTHDEHKRVFDTVRELSSKYDEQLSIICDIQGPKIRTGVIKEAFNVNLGDVIRVTPDEIEGNRSRIQVVYPQMLTDLHENDIIYINDGIIKLVITTKENRDLICTVAAGGTISSHKGVNIPSGNISMEVVTEKDAEDLKFIAKLNPEYVAASFIGTADDVFKVKHVLAQYGNTDIKIIAKIERPVALQNLDSIIQAADALMVARGDLGVEIPPWEVPAAQKLMIKKCNAEGKPVICATQMLESMTNSSRPTRAEANDVFNAVLDGADAVMLSAETSVGKYPIDTVRIMDQIIETAERSLPKRNPADFDSKRRAMTETMGHACYTIVDSFPRMNYQGKIIVMADSGYTARMVSKYRPNMDIVAVTNELRTSRELNLVWGVRTVFAMELQGVNVEDRCTKAIKYLYKIRLLNMDDHAIVISRSMLGKHVGSCTLIYDVRAVLTGETRVK